MSATDAPGTATERRFSLSRGPALIVGTILLAAGLYFMYRQHTYPRWSNFPSGGAPVDRHVLGIFGINGFTGLLTAIAGGLLLFGAAEHYLAKTMSLIVGVVLGAAAIIALISGNVLGLAAANGWTELGWAIAAAVLLINVLIPARHRTIGAAGAAAGDVAARRRTTTRAEDPALARTGTPAAPGTIAPGAAAAGAGTAGTAAGAEPGAAGAETGAGARTGDLNYTRRITNNPNGPEPAEGDRAPAAAGTGAAPTNDQEPVGTGSGSGSGSGSGGGPLSRLFGRRS